MKHFNFLIFVFIFLTFSCKDEELTPDIPIVLTGTIEDISPQGTLFTGRILTNGDLPSDEKGFVWDTIASPSIEKSYSRFTAELNKGTFSKQIDFDLISGKNYFVRAFIEYGDKIIYGNQVIFKSQGSIGPVIESFSPAIGVRSDTIVIKGDYFSSRKTNNIVKVGGYVCTTIESSKNELKVVLPDNIYESNDVNVTVEVYGVGLAESNFEFRLDGPIINTISPLSGPCKSPVITIEGTGFSTYNYGNDVYATRPGGTYDYRASIIEYSENTLKLRFPTMIPGLYEISMRSNGITYKSNFLYELEATEIYSISPMEGPSDTDIVITGKFLEGSMFYFDGIPHRMIDEQDHAIMRIPVKSELGEYEIGFRNDCQYVEYPQKFNLTTPWELLTQFPGTANSYAYSFSIDGELYILMGQQRCGKLEGKTELWSYNLDLKEWKRRADFPAWYRWGAAYCTIGNRLFFGTGKNYLDTRALFNDFWEYNSLTDEWKQLAPLPGAVRSQAVCFALDDRIFLGCGEGSNGISVLDMYEYHQTTNSWEQIPDVPAASYSYNPMFREFKFEGKLYLHGFRGMGTGNPNLFELDFASMSWKSKEIGLYDEYEFVLYDENRNFFIGHSKLFEYNPLTDERTYLPSHYNVINVSDFTGTLAGNSLLIGLGYLDYNICPKEIYYFDINE
jgi:hypothetical protein